MRETVADRPKSLISKISKAITHPAVAYDFVRGRLANKSTQTAEPTFVGAPGNRSESDNGDYVAFVETATRDFRVFSRFKTHPIYQSILEHVTKSAGEKFMAVIQRDSPDFIEQIEKFKINDLVGSPIMHSYPAVGLISPTTLRYVKVASDLRKYFGSGIGNKLVEIGVGYGGQLLVLDQVFRGIEYHLYDLPPVLELASKYLEAHILNCSYRKCTLNQNSGNERYDLGISNYAFSELPSRLQRKYIEKILSRASRGYLTMNSGLPDCTFSRDKLLLNELREL
jgi:hypothetical protein